MYWTIRQCVCCRYSAKCSVRVHWKTHMIQGKYSCRSVFLGEKRKEKEDRNIYKSSCSTNQYLMFSEVSLCSRSHTAQGIINKYPLRFVACLLILNLNGFNNWITVPENRTFDFFYSFVLADTREQATGNDLQRSSLLATHTEGNVPIGT